MNNTYAEYLMSPEWQVLRGEALAWAEDRCQVCYSSGPLDVHHRTYDRLFHEKLSDLTVLCHACHSIFHGKVEVEAEKTARRKELEAAILERLSPENIRRRTPEIVE
jgi:5-methylcytosine-specific restriction endonuclease McrA